MLYMGSCTFFTFLLFHLFRHMYWMNTSGGEYSTVLVNVLCVCVCLQHVSIVK